MRLHFCSDLHLEAQEAPRALPSGDVLVVAGDLCHARTLVADLTDLYAARQRERVLSFIEMAQRNFGVVLVVLGNHDHYDGMFEETAGIYRRALGVTVLDDDAMDLGGMRIFGTTLWSDFDGRDEEAMRRAGKGCGEFFFVRRRDGDGNPVRFRPRDALAAHDAALAALRSFLADEGERIVVSHHAPSRRGLNPLHMGNGLDGAYASALDALIEESGPRLWIHGHTHVRRSYRIGGTELRTNCLGFRDRDPCANGFSIGSVDL